MSEHDDDQKPPPEPPRSPEHARQQAAEFLGFTASKVIPLPGGGQVEITNPGMFDDDQQERWDALQILLESCEKAPDIEVPEQTVTTKDGNSITTKARKVAAGYLQPLRRKGENGQVEYVKPGYAVRQAIAVLGEEGYAKFKAGGGRANDISLILSHMQQEFEERTKRDPFRPDGGGDVAAVREGDSG